MGQLRPFVPNRGYDVLVRDRHHLVWVADIKADVPLPGYGRSGGVKPGYGSGGEADMGEVLAEREPRDEVCDDGGQEQEGRANDEAAE